MLDLQQLILNAKKDAKLDTKSQRGVINEVADIKVITGNSQFVYAFPSEVPKLGQPWKWRYTSVEENACSAGVRLSSNSGVPTILEDTVCCCLRGALPSTALAVLIYELGN